MLLNTAFSTITRRCRPGGATAAIQRCSMSTVVVDLEHGRGEWKTYGDLSNFKPGKFQIQTFNKISPKGLARFESNSYDVRTDGAESANAHAILLRSHKLKEEEVAHTVRAIAR